MKLLKNMTLKNIATGMSILPAFIVMSLFALTPVLASDDGAAPTLSEEKILETTETSLAFQDLCPDGEFVKEFDFSFNRMICEPVSIEEIELEPVIIHRTSSGKIIDFPDLTITSVGQTQNRRPFPFFREVSGLSNSIGTFVGDDFIGPQMVNAGDTLRLEILPAADTKFQLTPGYERLQLLFRYGGASANIFPPGTVTFNNVVGGTPPDMRSSNIYNESWIDFSGSTADSPSDVITFDSITISFVAPSDKILQTLPLSDGTVYFRSFAFLGDTTPYVDLVPVPVPSSRASKLAPIVWMLLTAP